MANEFLIENLSAEELTFLLNKAKKDSVLYRKILKIMFVGALFFSFGGAWKNIQKEGSNTDMITIFSWENYFLTLGTLAFIFFISVQILKLVEFKKLMKDLRQRQKIVEKARIEKKTYLPHNHTYHFYLNSLIKLSIQVQEQDFNQMEEGDEINIEYSKNANIYFGYF